MLVQRTLCWAEGHRVGSKAAHWENRAWGGCWLLGACQAMVCRQLPATPEQKHGEQTLSFAKSSGVSGVMLKKCFLFVADMKKRGSRPGEKGRTALREEGWFLHSGSCCPFSLCITLPPPPLMQNLSLLPASPIPFSSNFPSPTPTQQGSVLSPPQEDLNSLFSQNAADFKCTSCLQGRRETRHG